MADADAANAATVPAAAPPLPPPAPAPAPAAEEEQEEGRALPSPVPPPVPPALPPRPASTYTAAPTNSLAAARATQLQALVEKRTMNLDYLRRAHCVGLDDGDGGGGGGSKGPPVIHWLNTVALERASVRAYIEAEVWG